VHRLSAFDVLERAISYIRHCRPADHHVDLLLQ